MNRPIRSFYRHIIVELNKEFILMISEINNNQNRDDILNFINDFKKGFDAGLDTDLSKTVVDSIDYQSNSDSSDGSTGIGLSNEDIIDEIIYDFNDLVDLPTFIGGSSQLSDFLETNMVYPKEPFENEIEGVVMVYFVINKDGTISDISVGEGNKDLQRECKRLREKSLCQLEILEQ
jgi:hypothetical protein